MVTIFTTTGILYYFTDLLAILNDRNMCLRVERRKYYIFIILAELPERNDFYLLNILQILIVVSLLRYKIYAILSYVMKESHS